MAANQLIGAKYLSTAKFEFDQHLLTNAGCLVIFSFNLVFPIDLGGEVGSVRICSTAQKKDPGFLPPEW